LSSKSPLERVQESEKLLERIMLVLPGFRGYKLREQRREADRIVRDHIYRTLENSRNDLMRSFQILSDSKNAELLEPMNRIIAKLDRIAERIKHASYGYSGFFDSVKIEEPQLDRMLAYDTHLMDLARKFSEHAAALRSDLDQKRVEGARSSQETLDSSLRGLESAFDERRAVIEGVKV